MFVTQGQAIAGVADWAKDVIPELNFAYEYEVTAKTVALPDLVVDLDSVRVSFNATEFPLLDLQGHMVVTYSMVLSFMVDNSEPSTAADSLRSFGDRLLDSILSDGTLGGRVQFASPQISLDYSNPFMEYEDGTRGREMVMTMLIGNLVEEQQ
jgi:hypothetical protein